MKTSRGVFYPCWVLLSAFVASAAIAQAVPGSLLQMEEAYADFNDAYGAVSLIDSDPTRNSGNSYAGRSREAWQQIYAAKRSYFMSGLGSVPAQGLSKQDARAVQLMRTAVGESAATAGFPRASGAMQGRAATGSAVAAFTRGAVCVLRGAREQSPVRARHGDPGSGVRHADAHGRA